MTINGSWQQHPRGVFNGILFLIKSQKGHANKIKIKRNYSEIYNDDFMLTLTFAKMLKDFIKFFQMMFNILDIFKNCLPRYVYSKIFTSIKIIFDIYKIRKNLKINKFVKY
jgi:hypothetical protein